MTDNPHIKIFIKKTENRITFEVKAGYYLELLIPEIAWKHLENDCK